MASIWGSCVALVITRSRDPSWAISEVEGKSQKTEGYDHEEWSISAHNRRHPRTGDAAQDQQGRQPASARCDKRRK